MSSPDWHTVAGRLLLCLWISLLITGHHTNSAYRRLRISQGMPVPAGCLPSLNCVPHTIIWCCLLVLSFSFGTVCNSTARCWWLTPLHKTNMCTTVYQLYHTNSTSSTRRYGCCCQPLMYLNTVKKSKLFYIYLASRSDILEANIPINNHTRPITLDNVRYCRRGVYKNAVIFATTITM